MQSLIRQTRSKIKVWRIFPPSINISSFTAAASFFLMKQRGAAGCHEQITTTPQTITQSIINPNASWVKHTHAIISLPQLCLRNRWCSRVHTVSHLHPTCLTFYFHSSYTLFPLVSQQGGHRSNQTCESPATNMAPCRTRFVCSWSDFFLLCLIVLAAASLRWSRKKNTHTVDYLVQVAKKRRSGKCTC